MQLQKERRAWWWRYGERAVEEKKERAQMERKNEKVTEEK